MNNTRGNSWGISRNFSRTGNPSAWKKYDFLGCNRRFRLGFWCRSKDSPSHLLRFSIVFELHFESKIYDQNAVDGSNNNLMPTSFSRVKS